MTTTPGNVSSNLTGRADSRRPGNLASGGAQELLVREKAHTRGATNRRARWRLPKLGIDPRRRHGRPSVRLRRSVALFFGLSLVARSVGKWKNAVDYEVDGQPAVSSAGRKCWSRRW